MSTLDRPILSIKRRPEPPQPTAPLKAHQKPSVRLADLFDTSRPIPNEKLRRVLAQLDVDLTAAGGDADAVVEALRTAAREHNLKMGGKR